MAKARLKTLKSTITTVDGISVHPLTQEPDKVWKEMKDKVICEKVTPLDSTTHINSDKIRFVCISDTHTRLEKKPPDRIPGGDVLLHAGDITNFGSPKEIYKFNEYLGKLPHTYKIVITGNHDVTFDKSMLNPDRIEMLQPCLSSYNKFLESVGAKHVKDLLTNCIYLEDSGTEVFGIKIYGSPWTPQFMWWGFNARRGIDILDIWSKIPTDTDILITHGPTLGYGDKIHSGRRVGCVELLSTIQQRVKPKYHVFGHIHEGYGVTTDGTTTFVNAATCNVFYKADNPPIIFDYPLPAGVNKTDFTIANKLDSVQL